MTTNSATASCPTCGQARDPEDFYATSAECRPCKRQRSQQNRANAAHKVTLADRLIEVLERLAEQGWKPDALLIETKTAPARVNAPGPESTRQGVNP